MKESFKRTEIGSEFWSVPLANEENRCFAPHTEWFLSGRSALDAIIAEIKKSRDVRRAWLPSWCCDSMILPFLKHGLEVKFYPVLFKDGQLVQDVAQARENEILFLMDYFGYTSSEYEGRRSGTVIRDVTHSVFSHTYADADYYFGSLRKWCGFKTGGFAVGLQKNELSSDGAYVSLRERAMREKHDYMCGRSESKDFLRIFAQAEEHLETCGSAGADSEDVSLALHLDIAHMKARRRKNAARLLQTFRDIAVFKDVKENDCPLFVPVMIAAEKRDAFRRYLIERQIYLPVHWPISSVHGLDECTKEIYEGEISLVCDQRYDEKDMDRIVETVNQFLKR